MKPVYKMRPKKAEGGRVADEWEPYVDRWIIDDDDEEEWEDEQEGGAEAVDAAKKSFFEAIWERDHPDDVKKIKIAQEKKKIDE